MVRYSVLRSIIHLYTRRAPCRINAHWTGTESHTERNPWVCLIVTVILLSHYHCQAFCLPPARLLSSQSSMPSSLEPRTTSSVVWHSMLSSSGQAVKQRIGDCRCQEKKKMCRRTTQHGRNRTGQLITPGICYSQQADVTRKSKANPRTNPSTPGTRGGIAIANKNQRRHREQLIQTW